MIPEIATAVQTASTLITLTKKAKKIADTLKQAELKAMLAEIISAAADVKLELADANGKIVSLKERIAELEAFEDISEKIEITSGRTILKEDHKGIKAGTYLCPACYAARKLLVPVARNVSPAAKCPNCGSSAR